MIKKSLLALTSLMAFFWPMALNAETNPASSSPIVVNQIVALVNDGILTQSQLDTSINLERMQAASAGVALPEDPSLARQSLQRLITQTGALQLATRNQITVSDQSVTDAINQILARGNHTHDELLANLKNFNLTENDYRSFIRNQLLLRALAEKAIASNITVTPDEINAYLAQQKQGGTVQETYHVAHILIAFPPNPTPEDIQKTKAQADQVFDELKKGLDFTTAAMKYSGSEDASTGGDLGDEPLNMLPTLFIGPVKTLKPGEVSEPFSSPSGYHLVKLLSVKNTPPPQHFVTQYQIKQIIIRTSPILSDSQAETILNHLKIALQNGKSFDVLARENSQDPLSASKGGLMDFGSLEDFGPYYGTIIQELKPGQVSDPFRVQGGWALIQLIQSREYNDTADFAKKEASNVIFQKKAMDAMDTWEAQIRGESYVKILIPELKGSPA